MRLVKILIALCLLALIVAGVLVWTLPADIAYRHGARSIAPLALTGIRGTIWDGHADGVSALGRDLGEIEWHTQKLPLLRGELVTDIRVQGAGVGVAGTLSRRRGSLSAHNLRFGFPAAMLEPALGIEGLNFLGNINGVIDTATLANAKVEGVAGSARWSDAGVTGVAEARFSDLLAQFASQADGSVTGSVRDDGSGNLAVDGHFDIRLASFDAQARLAARNDDQQVAQMLRHVGQMQADGSSMLVVHGQMLKLF